MREGRIVQVGTPEEIYTRPDDRFVAEFMGEVNVIPVRRRANGLYEGAETPGQFRVAGAAAARGLHRRPPGVPALPRAPRPRPTTSLEGRLYNYYSLGSRMQYRVRVGEKVLVVEQSRAAAPAPAIDAPVLVGWDGPRRDLRGTLMTPPAPRAPPHAPRRRPLRAAPPRAPRRRLPRAAPRRRRLLVRDPAQLRGLPDLHAGELRRDLRPRQHRLDLLRLVARPRRRHRPDPAPRRLPDRLRPRPRVRPLLGPRQPPLRLPALRLREHPPLRLGAVPHQGRRARRDAAGRRPRRSRRSLHPRRHPLRHGLRLPAVHAVPGDPRPVDRAPRPRRGRPRHGRRAACRSGARSSCRSPCPASSSACS